MASKGQAGRRSSMNQPVHWRPPYFKTERSWQCYMGLNSSDNMPRSPGKDHGLDNFSFDPAYLQEWQMPAGLSIRLPPDLHDAARNWEMAGAALCTSIQRTTDLAKEALGRAYPEKSHGHLHYRRLGPRQSSAGAGAETPPMTASFSNSPTSSMPEGVVLTHKIPHLPLTHLPILAMESPPMTPVDTGMASTPVYPTTVEPDLALVTDRLFPLSSRESGPLFFDESSWERYVKVFKISLEDVHESFNRLKGFARVMDVLATEYAREDNLKDAMAAFTAWFRAVKPKLAEYEGKVLAMPEPDLERVQMEWQMLRAKECKDY